MKNLLYASVALLLLGCSSEKTPDEKSARTDDPTQVRLALNWFPEAEHGGFYAALVHGYYQKRGLQVEILGGGADPSNDRVPDWAALATPDWPNCMYVPQPIVGNTRLIGVTNLKTIVTNWTAPLCCESAA